MDEDELKELNNALEEEMRGILDDWKKNKKVGEQRGMEISAYFLYQETLQLKKLTRSLKWLTIGLILLAVVQAIELAYRL